MLAQPDGKVVIAEEAGKPARMRRTCVAIEAVHGAIKAVVQLDADCPEEMEAMENEQWQEIVGALVDAKRCLAGAWQIPDGTDGAASGVEHALHAALASIDGIYAIEQSTPTTPMSRRPSTSKNSGRSMASFLDLPPGREVTDASRLGWSRRFRRPAWQTARVTSGQRRVRNGTGRCRVLPVHEFGGFARIFGADTTPRGLGGLPW